MALESIELSGFKSFAKKSVLEFRSPITAVVGPNGSGKSNVLEAFRFVLGEQSIRSMRGKRGEDLIWNGAASEPRAGRASVKIVFDNSKKIFNLDFPEIIIERVVNRDGTNEYLLNGSAVRLKDIHELLAAVSLGSSGHHIISQGEADRILNASYRERKSIVEDALGLKIYQYKRIESEKKLEKTRENIAQVESLRRELSPHLRFLRRQIEKHEKAEFERQELVELAKKYFSNEEEYLKIERETIGREEKRIELELSKSRKNLEEAKRTLERLSQSGKKDFEILECEKGLASIRHEVALFERELGKIEGLIGAETELKKRDEAHEKERKIVPLQALEKLYEEIAEMAFVEKIRERVREFITEVKRGKGDHEVGEGEKRLKELNLKKSATEERLRETNSKEADLYSKYENLRQEIERDKDSGRDAEKEMFRIMAIENELLSQKKHTHSRHERLVLEEAEFKRELEEVAHLAGPEVLKFRETGHNKESLATDYTSALRVEQDGLKREIQRLKFRLEDAGYTGSAELKKEYKDANERDEFLEKELLDLEQSASFLEKLINELESKLSEEFSDGLNHINREFKTFFSDLFGGGEAKLTLFKESRKKTEGEGEEMFLEEGEEMPEEGLDISVSLPRKKIKSLMMLSGGERALTSIALIFAISQVNPPPFIILDETDAALDEANSKKYGDMIVRLSKKSQLILITHNRETMSRAGVIYGVTMGSTGVSKLLSIEFDEAVQVAK